MEITIINKLNWSKTYIELLNEKHEQIAEMEVANNRSIISIDIHKHHYGYLTNKHEKTDVFIITRNMPTLEASYNEMAKRYDVSFWPKTKDYGQVINWDITDEKNLFFRPDKTKRVNIWLPPNYDSHKAYHLLLMFDSQNLFDVRKVGNYTDKNDPYYGWQVETTLSNKSKDFIVVGIENADGLRMTELMPSVNESDLKPEAIPTIEEHPLDCKLDNFGSFIIETLLPILKKNYQILDIGIAGSSAGGIAAHYLGIKYSEIFSYILALSPASGLLSSDYWHTFYQKYMNKEKLPKLFYYQGCAEGLEQLLFSFNQDFFSNLADFNYPTKLITKYIELSGDHNEVMWRFAFNYGIEQLYTD